MGTTTINSFEELHRAFEQYRADKRWAFRGHASAEWMLLPKAGRDPYRAVDDSTVFKSWKRQAVAHVNTRPQNDWEWLAIAQHHGLATRLLDWTTNPLIAAYFCVKEELPVDAKLTAVKFKLAVPEEDRGNPFKFKDMAAFRPHRVASRITQQQGLFSMHPNPKEALDATNKDIVAFDEIIIPASYRKELRSQLSFYGFNDAYLFPDLDGISSFINWTIESREYWRFPVVTGPSDVPHG